MRDDLSVAEGTSSLAYEQQALIFKALGHPSRLAIVAALADGERGVTSIREIVGSDLSTISRHLQQLKTAGVLVSRREGKQVLYRLRTPCAVTMLRCLTALTEPVSTCSQERRGPL